MCKEKIIMLMQKRIYPIWFTLIEMIVAMGVFSVLLVIMLSFFGSAQRAWSDSSAIGEVYENARIAMDLMARDIQSAYYEADTAGEIPFWHRGRMDSVWGANYEPYYNECLSFISVTDPPNSNCSTKLCEVEYQLAYHNSGTTNPKLEGWLRKSVTGDFNSDSPKTVNKRYNFRQNFNVGDTDGVPANPTKVFTGNYASRGDMIEDDGSGLNDTSGVLPIKDGFKKIIPYMVHLEFHCFKKDGTEIEPDATGSATTVFPYSINFKFILLDRTSWDKWKALGGDPTQIYYNHAGNVLIENDNPTAKDFRLKRQRVFTKTIYLGDRGEKY